MKTWIVDNLIPLAPCIGVLAFSIYLIYSCIKGQKISDKDYREWCIENNEPGELDDKEEAESE